MAKQFKYDVAKQGPLSWRDLQEANNERFNGDEESQWIINKYRPMSPVQVNRDELLYEGPVQSPILRNSNGRDYWGKSMWDTPNATAEDFYNNLSDLRGQNQPWYAQLGAGLLKGVTTFGTTWLDGTVGLLYGIGAAIGTAFDDKATGWDAAAKIFHNSVSDSLQDFNEFMEEFAPNYKSRDEENNKWYQNMGTMNFWADGLIKNLGFTVGAFYSGAAFTKAIKGVGGLIAAGKAGKAAKAYKAAKVEEIMKANPKITAEEAAKAISPMATAIKYTNALKAIEGARSGTGIAVAGSLFSAVNEGRIEANQVYRDAFTLGNTPEESKGAAAEILAARNRKMQEIEDNPTLLPSEKQALQAQVNANSQKLLAEAEQNAAKAGMLTLGLNIPILTIDNFKMYGRLYSRGFKQSVKQVSNNVTTQELKAAQEAVKNATTKQEKEAAKRALKEAERKAKAAHNARNNARIDDVAENVTDKEGRLAWNEITKGQAAWKGIKSGLMEGNEEMMQAWASGTAGNMTMPEDPDAYYKALTDPNVTVKTNDFLTSVTKGFLDSYGNGDRWEEGAIGFLTGILGMPTFGARANSDSNTYLGRGKMIGLSGGFFGEFSNANYLNRLGAESVKNINAFRDKYKQHAQFLAQSQAFTDAMDGYLQDRNEFAYNNARDNDDYAMIQALAVTGRIDEVKAMLNFKEEDLTDDVLDSIARDFTENSNLVDSDGNPKTVDDSGKPLQGAWRDKAGNLMSRTDEGKAEMKAKLLEKQKRLNEEIDDYVASLDSVRAQVNNSLDESQVRELAWIDWKNKQWSRRFQDIQGTQEKAFDRLLEATEEALNAKTDEGEQYYTNEADSPIKREKLENLRDLLKEMKKTKSPREILNLLIKNTDTINSLFRKPEASEKEATLYDVVSGWINDPVALADLAKSLYDIRLMAIAQKQFSDKLDEYTSNPSKLAENRQRIEEERQQAQSVTDDINTRRKLKNISVKDYMGLSDEDKEKVKAQAKDFDDDDINNIIVYGDEIDEKTEKMLNEVFGDEDTDETTKSLLAEAIAAMKDEAEKPEQITIHSEAYLEWRRNKLNEYKNNGKYDEGLEYLNGLDEYLLRLMSDYSDDDSDFEDEDFDDGEPEDFDDEDAPSVDDFDDDDSTGHDATTSVQSVREKQKKDKKKEEKKKKKEEELTYADELWKRLTDIAPEGKEEVVESTAKPIREKLGKTVNDERKKGVKKIASGVVITFKAGMFPSDSYKELEQIIGDKALLEKTIIGIINDYIEYINGILAKEVADNKAVIEGDKKKAEEPEEEVRTPVIPESEIDTYAESQHKNRSGVGRDTQKNYWLPRTTQYGIGSTEFSKPKFDKDTGRQLKYWERVKGGEGNYSPKLRAKIVTVGQWLDEHGVFDNVDGALNKTLKGGERGTEIAFTTNQELNDLVANAMWEADNKQGEKPKPVIILMAVGDDLHIVGDMAEPDLKNLGTQEKRLAAFVNDFNKRYGEWLGDSNQDHSKPFVHPMRTKIHQGLVGRMIYNEKKDRNTLNSIFGNGIILGVALRDSDSGKLDVITNPNKSKKDAKTSMENDILQPQNPKAGQPYVVVPSLVSGKYICVPFTIPSLSEVRRIEGHENFGLIRNLNDALAEITSIDFTKDNVDTELIAAKDKLESILNVNLWIEHKDGKLIIKRKVDKKYVQIYAEPVENMRNFAESIITEFEKAGVGFQVDRKKINKGDYNRLIGEIANTNLPVGTEYHTKNDWFTVEPINVESGKKGRIASNIKSTGNNPNASDKIITVTRTAKDKSVTVTVDLENDTVSYTDSKGKLQVVPKSEFGTKENAHKAWAYAIGQAKEIFKEKPNKNTLPYQTKNNDEYFDPVNYRFLASKEEFDALCKERLTLPMAEDTLEADLKKSVGKDITVTITTKSKSGYPIVEIQRTDGENGVYTNKFRVSEEGNIESAAGWASDNPANWEVDNSVTNRGGDTISFTPVLDFYKTLGFTPKPTTTQTTTEQQPTVETKQETSTLDNITDFSVLDIQNVSYGSSKNPRKGTYKARKKENGIINTVNAKGEHIQQVDDVGDQIEFFIGDKKRNLRLGTKDFVISEPVLVEDGGSVYDRTLGMHQDRLDDLVEKGYDTSTFMAARLFRDPKTGKWYAQGQFGTGLMRADEIIELSPNFNLAAAMSAHANKLNNKYEQVATPQVSEQAPSTEITREEREEIIRNNSITLPKQYPSEGKNLGDNSVRIYDITGKKNIGIEDVYRVYNVNGDTAKYEVVSSTKNIHNWSSILDNVADRQNGFDPEEADTLYTVEEGTVKKREDGNWQITKKAKVIITAKSKENNGVFTDTDLVKTDLNLLKSKKESARRQWEVEQRLKAKQEQKQQNTTTQEVKQEVEQKEHIKEDFDDSFDVEEASPEVEQAIGEVIQGTNLGLSIDEVFKQNSSLEQLYNSNPQFKDSVDSLRKAMEENKQKEEEQKAREQQIAEEPAKTPDDIAKEYLKDAKDAEYEKMWNALSDEGKKNFIARYAKDSKTFNSKMREIKKFWNKKEGKFKLGGEPKFRVETKQDTTKWNREQEMAWLKKALPQLSNEQRVQVVDGLIKIADSDNPGYAWGQFYRGLITISSEAASGTLYHEAFHAVIDLLMTEDEYNKLFDAAYQVYGNLGMLGLEEKLAEEFRKFVQYGDNAAFVDYDAEDIKTPIIRGIVRLFRKLKALIQGLSNKQIYLNKLFYDINKGKFANRKIKENVLDKVTTRQEEDAQLVLDRNPELASVGTAREYAAYVNDIFPNSVEKDIYWHGSNEDFSDGFNTAKRGEGSGALETKKRNDLYLNKQGWASLQYVNGVNRTGSDKNGFAHWNKLWWELKEIMSNGRRENNDWKDIIITDKDVNSIRQAIPNKRGKFDRDKGGTHGKWLKERKADYGYENKSDKEFFEEVFGLQLGKDTFNTWTARNAEVFKAMETTAKGIYPVVINVTNPIVEEGQNTYYEEQRGLFSQADRNGNDAILSRSADNEFNSDVAVVINANNKNVHWLGTKSDIEQFRQWKAKNVKQPKFDINERELEDIKKKAIADGTFMKAPNGNPTNLNERQWLQVRTKAFKEWFGDWENDPENASKVVDENGEPLVVYHTVSTDNDPSFTIFDTNKEGRKAFIYTTDNLDMSKSYAYDAKNHDTGKINKKWDIDRVKQQIEKYKNEIQRVNKFIDRWEKAHNWSEYFGKNVDESDYRNFSITKEGHIIAAQKEMDEYKNEIDHLKYLLKHPEKMEYTKSLFVNIKRPLIIEGEGNWWNELNLHDGVEGVRQAKYMDNKSKYKKEVTDDYIVKHYGQNAYDSIYEYDIAEIDDYLTKEDYKKIEEIVNNKYPDNYTFESTRTIEDSIKENSDYDGMIVHNVLDYGGGAWFGKLDTGSVFAAKEPNQIKSATDNVGTFSRENDDIRYREAEQEMSVKQYHFQKLMYVNLSEEDKEYIKERGMSVRDYSSMSQAEKELFWKCR